VRNKTGGAMKNTGELWSFLRRVLSQGTDIQKDYSNGKYKSYEHFAIRLDAAARERVEELQALLAQEER
jgi:hypothetical protein